MIEGNNQPSLRSIWQNLIVVVGSFVLVMVTAVIAYAVCRCFAFDTLITSAVSLLAVVLMAAIYKLAPRFLLLAKEKKNQS